MSKRTHNELTLLNATQSALWELRKARAIAQTLMEAIEEIHPIDLPANLVDDLDMSVLEWIEAHPIAMAFSEIIIDYLCETQKELEKVIMADEAAHTNDSEA